MSTRASVAFDLVDGGAEYLRVWDEELPWAVKIEGVVKFHPLLDLHEKLPLMPPMVSRKYVCVDGIVWHPLFDLTRALKRLICDEQRDEWMEEALVNSAYMTLALHVYWQREGKMFSPAVHFLTTQFPADWVPAVTRAARLYRYFPRQEAVQLRRDWRDHPCLT
jgi:hypothetical protein